MSNLNYTSTRDSSVTATAAEAIVKGISEDGGLFVPAKLSDLPKFSAEDLVKLSEMSYGERAEEILRPLLGFTDEDLSVCVDNAYSSGFDTIGITRIVNLDDSKKQSGSSVYALELWHGPTSAFKDMALQILPELMNVSGRVSGSNPAKTLILTATSGDTGKAALEGFKDVPGVEIAVFYPENGVSETQKLQMSSQEGENVHVYAVKGNFDDCQNAVKAVFTDAEVGEKSKNAGVALSSANSINWGRLCPQIVYYIAAYAQMLREKTIRTGDKINICVPTGNFGNILAAYYAMIMGVPVEKLICASNTNNILTDLINTGVYDCNREFHTTVSPSMDILVSSNLERLLYHLSGENSDTIKELFASLKETGKFEVDAKIKKKLKSLFYGGWCSELETAATIKNVFNEHGYLMDTHTAVGYKVLRDYISNAPKSKIKTVVAATASPYKFSDAVYESLYGKYEPTAQEVKNEDGDSEFDGEWAEENVMDALEFRTGICIPKPLVDIIGKEARFTEVLEKSQIKDAVLKLI
ncbi:MAG: threonine synthase [Oscillospiraceae bacterium]|nr:threonine synthase [Oscillospiraceae bacterium]